MNFYYYLFGGKINCKYVCYVMDNKNMYIKI